ncbi:HAMP domain-containing histidine kinase [Ruminococcus sp. CLA-AA-H200]|uniref:histidine kinase n=1 Tax=Ruminococcus turbiniformis TaxID=2881258 RepID=A0ABS8FTW7_9FIRM|nr:HAMP domain-containing sensor histidine kinase [Ruminococcus turbiniformis]MCC2253418.1 HAMP domain-containing histidine kinase [Ruminococcus turbiniformis]
MKIQIGAGHTLKRLDEMLATAIDGTFEESRYDETELSRLETGILEVMPEEGSLTPLIEEVMESVKGKAAEKGIVLSSCVDSEIICVFDRKWTAEALNNVADNAVKYSRQGGHVEIRAKKYEFYACIEVEDEGIGIPEEERARIFGRFYRGKQVQQEEGVGVGLYLPCR